MYEAPGLPNSFQSSAAGLLDAKPAVKTSLLQTGKDLPVRNYAFSDGRRLKFTFFSHITYVNRSHAVNYLLQNFQRIASGRCYISGVIIDSYARVPDSLADAKEQLRRITEIDIIPGSRLRMILVNQAYSVFLSYGAARRIPSTASATPSSMPVSGCACPARIRRFSIPSSDAIAMSCTR